MLKFLLLFLLSCSFSFAAPVDYNKYDKYFHYYANKYGISYYLLKSVAVTENNKLDPTLINVNTNGTKDFGLMQINTIWAKEFNLEERDLLNIETNIHIAARILYTLIDRYGYSWETVGMYHSSTPSLKQKWVSRMKFNVEYLAKYDPKVTIEKQY